ncbi:hypothetical protein PG993_013162 [Apiospora rasikravindrae]|uniref:Uncharacterized protein n=1 Tax=Apiospora rasikravindrae TaxID=990691 RepID=A0ABR1RWV2_9PEZI
MAPRHRPPRPLLRGPGSAPGGVALLLLGIRVRLQGSKLLYVNDRHLRQLGCAIGTRRAALQDLPTWAIDLSRGQGHDEDGADRWTLYDAYSVSEYVDGTSGVKFMHDLQDPAPQVPGIYIGSVAACTNHKDRSSSGPSHEPNTIVARDQVQPTLDLVA